MEPVIQRKLPNRQQHIRQFRKRNSDLCVIHEEKKNWQVNYVFKEYLKYMASNPLHRKSILNFITELPVLSDQMEVEKVMLEMLSAGTW